MLFAHVAVAVPLRRLFDYKIPEALESSLSIGSRVEVPWGRQKQIAVVVNISDKTEFSADKIKPLSRIIDHIPLLDPAMVALKNWVAQYYVCPPGEVFINLLPKKLKTGEIAKPEMETYWQLGDESAFSQISKRAKKQLSLIEELKQTAEIADSRLKQQGYAQALIKKLSELGAITATEKIPLEHDVKAPVSLAETPLTLNDEQVIALEQINQHLSTFKPILLEGVTGSGKTEVYLQAIEQVLKQGKQVLVLVPEIGLTPQTLGRFRNRFNTEILTLHSELNDTERHNAWLKAKLGLAQIIIGTRSSVLVPMPSLGMIILDEEHDISYKQQDGLRYNARDIAVKRAHLQSIPVILGSATPSLETVNNANQNRYLKLKLTKRAQKTAPPVPELLDIKHQPMQAGLAYGVLQCIEQHLNAGNQVLIFLNRRGFSPALICHECGWVSECQRCDNHYTYHKSINQLQCHHCGDIQAVPMQCHDCGSTQIVDWGVGTEQLESFLSERFPEANTLRIDRDSTRRKGELERKLEAINKGEHQLLIGTQMLAKGHHFPNLTLTVVMNLDHALYSADFRALERMMQLLVQVSGRAGRGEKKGQVLLQTHNPEHELLQTIIKKGYADVQNYLLDERNAMKLPPFQSWALLRVEALQLETVLAFCQQTSNTFNPYLQSHYQKVVAIPAMPAPQEKRAGRYRYLMVFESNHRGHLNAAMQHLTQLLEAQKGYSTVRWTLDIDPQELN
ncbi:primosomal protein N' [Catenovulum sp. SM1970]|nr:primosomal protein N' [Marinifaba aquimaris]